MCSDLTVQSSVRIPVTSPDGTVPLESAFWWLGVIQVRVFPGLHPRVKNVAERYEVMLSLPVASVPLVL